MNKQELISAVIEKAGVEIKNKDAEAVVDAVFEVIAEQAKAGRIQIHKFGSFAMKTRPARKARNPKTGATIDVPEQTKLVFKASKVKE